MKLFLKLLTIALVIGCVMLATGCKEEEKVPSKLPSESITESNGSTVEDEITVDELLGNEPSDSNDESKPTDGTTSNTTSDTNKPDNTDSSTPSTSSGENNNSSESKDENAGFVSGWY